ncbi:hypothetical protein AVEN_44794-1 [Araneus ventricosus]|uniref:Uncharacterized protein n=1 Tax=Araneus ventricosus TaxID=182803 RepID=A0A4Y2V0I6_ARAVE|nr:hypothetical protein AVEN_44794-1 [Araneus ventricosus]
MVTLLIPHTAQTSPLLIFISFCNFKVSLSGKKFQDDKALKEDVTTWLESEAVSFFDRGMQNINASLKMCLNTDGIYVWCVPQFTIKYFVPLRAGFYPIGRIAFKCARTYGNPTHTPYSP